MMSTKITILNASKKFDGVLALLEAKALQSLDEIQTYFDLPNIDIVISPCSDEYRTDMGIMGCVSTPDVIDILLDTEREDLTDIINTDLITVIAHELHHVIRADSGVKEKSLFQILISEGLLVILNQNSQVKRCLIFLMTLNSMIGATYIIV